MKKLILFLIVCSISLALLGNSKATNDGILLKYYPQNSDLRKNLQLKTKDILEYIILLPEVEFNQKEASAIIARLDQIPESLLRKIYGHRIKIKLFVGKLTDNPTVNHLKGVVPRGYKSGKKWDDVPGIGGGNIVLVKVGHSEKGMGHGSINLELHELAHSVDQIVFSGIRFNPQFLSIWQEEKNQIFPGSSYLLAYPEEYFAEAFALYYISKSHRDFLKKHAPKTYKYIKKLK